MSLKAVAPARFAERHRRQILSQSGQMIRDRTNIHMRHIPNHFKNLPLWEAAREAELRSLPLNARRLARRFGLDAATARLLASLASHDKGERS
jgi:hypothetical protein